LLYHRKGSLNVVSYSLSRINEDELAAIDLQDLLLVDSVSANEANFPDLKVDSGYLYRKAEHLRGETLHDEYAWKVWVPKEMIPEVLVRAHDSPLCSHGEIHKSIERLRRYYYWPGLVKYVKAYVNACEVCKSTKSSNCYLRPPLGKAPETQRFFQRLFIDFLGPYPRSRSGNVAIFIVLDHFSKYVFLKPVKRSISRYSKLS